MSCKKIIVEKEVIDFEEFLQRGRGTNRKKVENRCFVATTAAIPGQYLSTKSSKVAKSKCVDIVDAALRIPIKLMEEKSRTLQLHH